MVFTISVERDTSSTIGMLGTRMSETTFYVSEWLSLWSLHRTVYEISDVK